jgi:hypothetical protein
MTTLIEDPTNSEPIQPTGDKAAPSEPSLKSVEQQIQEILNQTAAMREQLSLLTERESELRAVLERETELEPQLVRLGKILRKSAMADQAAAAITDATLHPEPFPYTIIDNLLPEFFYDALVTGIPPIELFEHKPLGKQHLDVPFAMAPLYSRKVWLHMCSELVPKVIIPAIISKFRPHIDAWIATNWPGLDPESVELHGSGGRIMLRRRGYRIRPHRDPKWSFITCILQLARPGDSETWGTQILAVDDDREAKSAAPYWIDEKQCRLVEDVAFRRNRLLVFLNSVGAHSAHIPADAQPATLERYIYQFRVAPPVNAVARLKSLLPEERRPLWTGKALTDY